MSDKKDEKDLLLKELAGRLLMACETFRQATYHLRQLRLVARAQVADLGNQADLDKATPEQKNAWVVFNEANSILTWFDQQHIKFRDLSQPAATEPEAASKADDKTSPTVH